MSSFSVVGATSGTRAMLVTGMFSSVGIIVLGKIAVPVFFHRLLHRNLLKVTYFFYRRIFYGVCDCLRDCIHEKKYRLFE